MIIILEHRYICFIYIYFYLKVNLSKLFLIILKILKKFNMDNKNTLQKFQLYLHSIRETNEI